MSHKHKDSCFCDRPRKFRDKIGKGELNSTPIVVPSDFGSETGTSLDLHITSENTHPGPFTAAAFHPSSQKFFGLSSRRNTPNDSPERAGRVLMDDKKRDDDRFYKPHIKRIDRNFAKKKH